MKTMNGTQYRSRNVLIFLLSVIALSLIAVLGLLIWNTQAATPEPLPARPSISLNPSTGAPGTTILISGSSWQPSEMVLVYLEEVDNGSSDGIVYGNAVADSAGRILASVRYPQAGPWTGRQEAIVSLVGVSSGAEARAQFEVILPTGEPATEKPTTQSTATLVPDRSVPLTATAAMVVPTRTPVPPSPTPVPPTPIPPTPSPPPPSPTPARITDWRGEYYNNVSLTGSPLVRNDLKIDFDWGKGSPMKGINSDGFYARWTRQLVLEAKNYRFNVRIDDGVRLWVDGQLLIDDWNDGGMRTLSVERAMTAGKHAVRVEMYERGGRAAIAFWREAVESYPDWKGEYFGNMGLNGAPILVRNDRGIDFDWGGGAPAPAVPADGFSVRWVRQLHFPAGHYRFTVHVDDGVRLWVDGIPVIDQWRDGIGTYTGDIYLSEGTHRLRMEMYEHMGGALARMWWGRQEGFPEWRGEYYANRDLAGEPSLVRNDAKIDFDWGASAPAAGLPADRFSVRWTRRIDFSPGTYRFSVEVDDGVRLWVDDQVVIDRWQDGIGTYSGDVYLDGGRHRVRLELYEPPGDAKARLLRTRNPMDPTDAQWKGK